MEALAKHDLPVPVLAWLLLEALYIPRRTWPLVLAPWQGRLPEDEAAIRELLDVIRHQGHVAESPQAGSHSWTRLQRSHFAEDGPGSFFDYLQSGGSPLTEDYEGYWGGPSESHVFYDDEGWPSCGGCGAYMSEYDADSEANSTDTGSEWAENAEEL